jgi:large subunit ribosomal protein L9
MKAILLESVSNLGKAGDVADVSSGYFRNFLKPRNLAVEATDKNMKLLEKKRLQMQKVEIKKIQDAKVLTEKIEELTVTARLKAGEEDKLFGSVTSADIAELLKEKGFDVDKKSIELTEQLNKLGLYTVHVHLHPEIVAKLKVLVEKE